MLKFFKKRWERKMRKKIILIMLKNRPTNFPTNGKTVNSLVDYIYNGCANFDNNIDED